MKDKNEKKLQPELRKVVLIAGSFYLCIPKRFVNHYGIKAGDAFSMIAKPEMINAIPMKGDF